MLRTGLNLAFLSGIAILFTVNLDKIEKEIASIKNINALQQQHLVAIDRRIDGIDNRIDDLETRFAKALVRIKALEDRPDPAPAPIEQKSCPIPTKQKPLPDDNPPHPSRWLPTVVDELRKYNFTDFEIAALVGNMAAESSISPFAKNHIAKGLIQWVGGRQDNLHKLAKLRGTSWDWITTQTELLAWECGKHQIPELGRSTEVKGYKQAIVDAGTDVGFAGYLIGKYFERPSPSELAGSAATRSGVAKKVYEWLKGESK